MFAGLCFLFNALTGPAIPYTASNFQTAGWVFVVFMYILLAVMAGFCNLFLVEAMQSIPGQKHFQGEVEFSTLINFFCGPTAHIIGQLLLYGAIQSNAIQSIVLTAQVIERLTEATDNFLVSIIGKSCGLSFNARWICVVSSSDIQSPSAFGDTMMIFSFGFVLTLLIAAPFFFVDLDSSISLIIGASILSLLIGIQWVTASIVNGLNAERVAAIAPLGIQYGQTMGTVMMNLACATVIPSWVNIKSMNVNTQSTMWKTLTVTTFYFLVIGFFFSLGFDGNTSNNSLQALLKFGQPRLICQITVALYAYTMLLPSVPVSFIVSYNNLVQNDVCSKSMAVFLAFILPCFACVPLQTRNYLFSFLTWTSLLFISTTNFILPLIIYLKSTVFRKEFNSDRVLTYHQVKLLLKIHSHSIEISSLISRRSLESLDHKGLFRSNFVLHPINTPLIQIQDPSGSQIDIQTSESSSQNRFFEISKNFIESPLETRLSPVHVHPVFYSTLQSSSTQIINPNLEHFRNRSANEYSKLSLRVPTMLESFPQINNSTFIDPANISIDWLDEDVPDPDADIDHSMEIGTLDQPPRIVEMKRHCNNLSVNVDIKLVSPQSLSVGSSSRLSALSLPREPQFKSPPFRAVPIWFPVRPKSLAVGLLIFMILMTVVNIVINGFFYN